MSPSMPVPGKRKPWTFVPGERPFVLPRASTIIAPSGRPKPFDPERVRGLRNNRHNDHVTGRENARAGALPSGQTVRRGDRRAGRWLWLALAWSAIAGCLLTVVAVIDVHRFLYGDTPVLRVGDSPSSVAVSPDGRTVYLANSSDSITPVSAGTGKAGRPIAISGGSPGGSGDAGSMAITPDGRTLFTLVLNYKSETMLPLARVDLRTGREVGQVRVRGGVADFAMTRDGNTLYILGGDVLSGDRALYAVNAGTGRIERWIPAPDALLENAGTMALSPDGRTLYVTTMSDDDGPGPGGAPVMVGAITPVDVRTGAAGRSIEVGWEPTSLAFTPNGRTLYAAIDGIDGESGQAAPNRVKVIDTATGQVRASILWHVPPLYVQMAPDGKTVWVVSISGDRGSTADNTVTPIAVDTDQPGRSFRTSGWLNAEADGPSGVAMSPDGHTLYVTVGSGLEKFPAKG
jgi:DNA-binding beta-propeller fold protein YncE